MRALSGAPGPLMSPEEVEAAPPGPWSPAQGKFVTEVFSHHIVGSPATVKAGLEDLAKRTGADELMIANIMYGYENRLRSYELIADACLTGNAAQAGHAPEDSPPTEGVAGALQLLVALHTHCRRLPLSMPHPVRSLQWLPAQRM